MSYQVTVAPGKSNVVMPDGLRYKAGDVVTLGDDQYAQLSPSAASSLLSSVTRQTDGPNPADNYLLGWTGPPDAYASNNAPTFGELYLQRVTIMKSGSVTNVYMFITSAGSSMTAAANFAGVYVLSGANLVLKATTGDISASWTSSHVARSGAGPGLALTSSVAVSAGDEIWVAQVFNSTGAAPQLAGGAQGYWDQPSIGAGVANWASPATPYTLAPAGFRYASYNSGLTALPSTAPLSLCNPDKAFFSAVG